VVTDSFADEDEARNMYNIPLVKLDQIKDLDAIVLAVGHDDYKKIKPNAWEKILNKNAVFIDVKSIYSKDYFIDTTNNHWRL
jgi:UDP-N-acetyl-D-galactosamine dehydrogenase